MNIILLTTKYKSYFGTRGGFILLQVARISINPSTDWVSNSFNQLILETCMMKMETKRALKIECIIRMEEPVLALGTTHVR